MDTPVAPSGVPAYDWAPQPQAATLVRDIVEKFLGASRAGRYLADRMHRLTGTRLGDWIDHLAIPADADLDDRLTQAGFRKGEGRQPAWTHPGGMFPTIVVHSENRLELAIKVESVADFLFANGFETVEIEGEPLAPFRRARFDIAGPAVLSAVERHGYRGFQPVAMPVGRANRLLKHGEAFLRRRRHLVDEQIGFAHASALIAAAIEDIGVDRAADLFFAAERAYWMDRNRAGKTQKARQDHLGLGWGNHDHHTYRSSREHFAALIAVFETLGLVCRERFYAGDHAGWGAQVLEQPNAGIVVFADVDLSPEEVAGDFAHQPLPPRDRLGTVGLWCGLHGEAFLEAGMHHLECQFDFAAEREQLEAGGIGSMKPFTYFPHLKQAFTEPETWPVDPARIERLLKRRLITEEQAAQFERDGAVGSHLEVLQRDDGYKGFNQTGISDIIRRTDPRTSKVRPGVVADTAA